MEMFEVSNWTVNSSSEKLNKKLFGKIQDSTNISKKLKRKTKSDEGHNKVKKKKREKDAEQETNCELSPEKLSKMKKMKNRKSDSDKSSGKLHDKSASKNKKADISHKTNNVSIKSKLIVFGDDLSSGHTDNSALNKKQKRRLKEKKRIQRKKQERLAKIAAWKLAHPNENKSAKSPKSDSKMNNKISETMKASFDETKVDETNNQEKTKRKRKKKNSSKKNKYKHLALNNKEDDDSSGKVEHRDTKSSKESGQSNSKDSSSSVRLHDKVKKKMKAKKIKGAENEDKHLSNDTSKKKKHHKKSKKEIPTEKTDNDDEPDDPIVAENKNRHDKQLSLKQRMLEKLSSARFRYLNEQLYTSTGKKAEQLFSEDSDVYKVYHDGFQNQVSKWPINPLERIIAQLRNIPVDHVVADMGCGEAKLAQKLQNLKVHSFDLVALNDRITVANISKVPLKGNSVDVVVFCLSLMGTNLNEYILEANRILKTGGIMKIAEVRSRFKDGLAQFVTQVEKIGFTAMKKDKSNEYFVMFDFKKASNNKGKVTSITLAPCIYKKR